MEWSECRVLPVPTHDAQVVVMNCKVHVGGGWISSSPNAVMYVSGFMCDSWDVIDSPTNCPALTTYHDKIVFIGGWDASTDVPTDELSVLHENKLQPLPAMLTKRQRAAAVSTGDHLIVAGGWGDLGRLNTVEVFDGYQWAEAENLPMACFGMKSVVHEGNWYLMGGTGQDKEVFCASLNSLIASTHSERTGTSVWKRLPELPFEGSSAAILGNCLIAIGGYPYSSDIYAYYPSTHSWVHVGDMLISCHSTCTVVLPTGELLMIGGWTNRGPTARVFKASLKGWYR